MVTFYLTRSLVVHDNLLTSVRRMFHLAGGVGVESACQSSFAVLFQEVLWAESAW